jgi:hypothetical protein
VAVAKSVKKKSSRTPKKIVTKADFSSLLRNGLSSHMSYVVLKQKSRSPVYLAFKPILTRINQVALYIGGKLSAFPNGSHEAWSGIDYEGKTEILKKAWKKLPQDRVSESRVGSHAGVFVSAGQADLKKLLAKAELKPMIKKLLDGIEENLGIEIENRLDVTKFLMLTYAEQLEGAFYTEGGSSLPPRQIGKVSDVAFGQQFSGNYGNTALVEFVNDHHLEAKASKQLQAA